MKIKHVFLAFSLYSSLLPAYPKDYFRYPSLHAETVVFTSQGDVWSASLDGGKATRLTTHLNGDAHASLSPDGKWVAYAASYEGPSDLFVMPVSGGAPRRITFDGANAMPLGWTAQGEVLYRTQNETGPASQSVVAAVDPDSLKKHVFPLADATEATVDDSGKSLYFTRLGLVATGDNAKQYKGGAAAQLWRYDMDQPGEAVKLSGSFSGSDRQPMWWNGRLYFISNRDGNDNLWSMQRDGSDVKQLTAHKEWAVRNAALDVGKIVYQMGADLHVYAIADGNDKTLSLELVSDHEAGLERLLRKPLTYMSSSNFSPDGRQIAITARGHIVLASVGAIRRVDIAAPDNSRASEAFVSYDGKWVYAICDASGEQEIWRFAADGSGSGQQLTQDGHMQRVSMKESPDGKWIAHWNKSGDLALLNLASRKNDIIDHSESADFSDVVWSPDSRTLASVRPGTAHQLNQIALYDVNARQMHSLTSDKYESRSPAFSADGHWLYFLSDRNFEPIDGAPWGDRNMGPYFDRRTRVYAYALQAGLRFPFQAKDELENAKKNPDEKDGDDNKQDDSERNKSKKDIAADAKTNSKSAKSLPLISWQGLQERLFEVPLGAGNYGALQVSDSRLYYLERARGENVKAELKSIAIDNKELKPELFAGELQEYALSGDRKKIYFRKFKEKDSGDMFIVDAAKNAPSDTSKSLVRIADWSIVLHPKEEWQQIFQDAWRMHRDYLFDAKMRGADWPAVKSKYASLLERVGDRAELNDVIGMMVSEVSTMHSQIVPGDLRRATDGNTPAFLGAVLERTADGARVKHIYRSEVELPDQRSPLAAPGVDVRDDDVIVAVNGKSVAKARDIADLLRNLAGQQTLLKIKRGGSEKSAVVIPVARERQVSLRYGDWELARRKQVERVGQSRIGYLHLRAMTGNDIATFAREFYANYDREGLIIDVRRNQGGNIDSWILEKLLRRTWSFWVPRDGKPYTNMPQTFRGHLVVLADELTYSDGESFTAGIKALGIGTVIGKRTAGAGVWLSDGNSLVDKGRARAAEFGVFSVKSGEWMIEGAGVSPDVEVDNLPHASFDGEDAQLDAALKLLSEKLKEQPVPKLQPTHVTPAGDERKPF
ncbi:S41 family peptidase [Collimonas pratensis]|uniref:Tricorn protease homolog n=1 Tax=Collimonas pratensis TaxID=279113 RepID=A0A127Q3V1_9BURK|nr:S41 family peptidase [Collimonas pratensis]AMP04697.1 peptidase S41 family protein [Collimonas pratensis]